MVQRNAVPQSSRGSHCIHSNGRHVQSTIGDQTTLNLRKTIACSSLQINPAENRLLCTKGTELQASIRIPRIVEETLDTVSSIHHRVIQAQNGAEHGRNVVRIGQTDRIRQFVPNGRKHAVGAVAISGRQTIIIHPKIEGNLMAKRLRLVLRKGIGSNTCYQYHS